MSGPCPSPSTLEAAAGSPTADAGVLAHIDGCGACRAAVEEIRANNHFLSGARRVFAAMNETGEDPSPGPTDPPRPDLVSGYEFLEEIHRGGQGVVYRAIQTRTKRAVAIKMLLGGHGASGRQKERFEREVRIAAGLRHPNIVTVHDSGFVGDGRYGLVMEYIEGVPLDRWSRSLDAGRGREARRRALRERLGVMAKVCDAVLCAHQHSIVHRDLKPANILVDAENQPHVLDFGIARDTAQHTRLTNTGEFAGTLAYASPEQVSGDPSRVDTRTDIYALGVIMYELVSGRMPYPVDGPMSRAIRGIESAEPAPLPRRTRDPDAPWVDGEVSTIILKAMAKDPARRYQTAAALRDDITRYLAGEAIEARRDSTWYVLRKAAARHRVVVAAAGLIFVLLAAFGAAMALQAYRLDARGKDLAAALSASNIERGRSLAAAGQTPLAEDVIFPELIGAGVTRINGPEAGVSGSPQALHAYWALWDVSRGSRCVATLRPPRKADVEWPVVKLLYFDERGNRLSALDGVGRLTSWSVATWDVVRDIDLFAPVAGADFRVALSPRGSIAVFGAGMIRVIDPETGAVDAQADDPDDQAVTGAFSPDGTLLATMGLGNRLRVRDARSPATVVMTTDGPGGGDPAAPLRSRLTFSPDGSLIVAVGSDGFLGAWDTVSGALERSLRPPASLVEKYGYSNRVQSGRVAFAPDGTMASWFGLNLVVWPPDAGEPMDLGEPGGMFAAVGFLPAANGTKLVSTGSTPGGGGGFTIIWDPASGHRVATFKHPDDSTELAWSPDGRLVAAGMSNGTVQVYEAAPEPHVRPLQDGRMWPFSKMALSPDGRHLALTTEEPPATQQDVVLVDVQTSATVGRFHRSGPEIEAIEFARDGLSLFEADRSGLVRQWELGADSCVRTFAFPEPLATEPPPSGTGGTNQLRLSPDGRILARARDDGLIGLWDVPSGLWLGLLESDASGYAVIDFSPDGRALVAHHMEAIVIWDVQTRRVKRTFDIDRCSANAVRWSPAGPVVARSAAGTLQFFDADTGRVFSECSPGTAGMGMAFHPEGTVFVASAWDTSVRLWDTRTGRELLSLQKHNQYIRGLVLTPDGNTLISSDWAGTVLVWDLTYYNEHIRRELATRASLGTRP